MKTTWAVIGAIFSLWIASGSLHAADKFRAASGGFGSAIHAALWAAYEKKIFTKYGLDVEYLAMSSGSLAMQTLLAGEIQVLFTTGALAVNVNLQGGDLTIFAGGMNFFPFKLVTRPEIRSVEDLKGKTLAISRFGSATEYAAQAALDKLGMKPRDVVLLQFGADANRLAALTGKSASGAFFGEPYATLAIKKFGMRSLIDLAESGLSFPQNSFIVRRTYLDANRGRIVNFMKGVIEGLYTIKKDSALALRLIKKYQRVDEDEAMIGYDYYVGRHGEGILRLPDREGLQFVISQVAKQNPKAIGQTPETLKLLEPSVLEEIKGSSFVEQFTK